MDYQILASDDKYSELIFEMHSQCEPTLTTRFSSDNQASGDELYVVIFVQGHLEPRCTSLDVKIGIILILVRTHIS